MPSGVHISSNTASSIIALHCIPFSILFLERSNIQVVYPLGQSIAYKSLRLDLFDPAKYVHATTRTVATIHSIMHARFRKISVPLCAPRHPIIVLGVVLAQSVFCEFGWFVTKGPWHDILTWSRCTYFVPRYERPTHRRLCDGWMDRRKVDSMDPLREHAKQSCTGAYRQLHIRSLGVWMTWTFITG